MIILECVREGSKLRIRFYCYIDSTNNLYKNVYNNNYNCMFPKDIRRVGEFYCVNDTDINLTARGGERPTYYYYYAPTSNNSS